jgi:hypothetical protein
MRNSDLGKAFEILKRETYRRYSGVCLEKSGTGWQVVDTNRWFPSWEVACAEIDKRQREMMELIKKQNPKT